MLKHYDVFTTKGLIILHAIYKFVPPVSAIVYMHLANSFLIAQFVSCNVQHKTFTTQHFKETKCIFIIKC